MENKRCQLTALGQQAIGYIVEQLNSGLALSAHLLRYCDIPAGRVSAFIEDVDKRAYVVSLGESQIQYGGVTSAKASLICLSKFIGDFLRQGEDYICLFENPNATLPVDVLSKQQSSVFAYNDEIYTIVRGAHISEAGIQQAVKESESGWIFIGCLTSAPNMPGTPSVNTAHSKLFETLSLRAEHIIVGAFDGEGYLIWSR